MPKSLVIYALLSLFFSSPSWAETCDRDKLLSYLATSPISITKPGSQEEKLRTVLAHPIFDNYGYDLLKESTERVYAQNLERGYKIELADPNNPLTPVEQAALWGYTQPHHMQLNFPIRFLKFSGRNVTDKTSSYSGVEVKAIDLAPYYELLISGLRKLKKTSGILYRGGNLSQSSFAKHKNKGTESYPFFFSTSTDRSISEGFIFDTDWVPVMFEIEAISGAMIHPVATFPDEYEVLFSPFSSFVVTEVIENSNASRISPHIIKMKQTGTCQE